MYKESRLLLAFLLGAAVATVQPAALLMAWSTESPETPAPPPQKATLKPAAATSTSADVAYNDSEIQSELRLLALANQARQQAGASPLTLDTGLSSAARIHAQAMMEAGELSHQFKDEPALPDRLAARTDLQLDQEGENVALDYDADHGHEHLMLSPPHRANLLNPAYNVVGLAVVRTGDRLFIVQDFGHALPNYSSSDMKDRIARAVNDIRHDAKLPSLERRDLLVADSVACSMAEADKLRTEAVHQLTRKYTVLTFTTLHPDSLPDGAEHAITQPGLHRFSVGECYGRTESYPAGMHWVLLSLE